MASLNSLTPFHFPFPSGSSISPVGFGTVKIGRNQKVKNKSSDGFSLPSLEKIDQLIGICLDQGVNLIDTAPAYGESEERLGKVLKGKRHNMFLASKVGEEFDGTDSTYNFSAEHTKHSIERSLQRLGTDYLDSVLVHCPRHDLEILQHSDVLETLSILKDQGKVRSFGASTNSIEGGLYTVQHCDSVMVSYNISYQKEKTVIEEALKANKGVFIKKGLLQGHLDDLGDQRIYQCFKSIYDISPHICVVVGTINTMHLQENLSSAAKALSN